MCITFIDKTQAYLIYFLYSPLTCLLERHAKQPEKERQMSDEKKPEKPLKNPQIHVSVDPKDDGDPVNRKTAERVQEKLREKVKEAIEEKKPGGKEKQFDAVES